MVNSYVLVNPHIEGNFKSKIKAKNSNEAANLFYKSLSEHFNNSVPSFHFTVQKGSSGQGKYYHFEAREERNGDQVDFTVKSVQVSGEASALKRFNEKLSVFKAKFAQDGGKKDNSKKKDKDDSSDDESSSEDFYKRAKSYMPITQPIYYWWYDPYIYNLNSLYIPTFYSYVTPYIELSLRL
jgi:hypothetical protein